jgi:hypothetical protein
VSGDSFQVQIRLAPYDFGGSVPANKVSVSVTTQLAAQIGTDRVTFGIGRQNVVQVNGSSTALSTSNRVLSLSGGRRTPPGSDGWSNADLMRAQKAATEAAAATNVLADMYSRANSGCKNKHVCTLPLESVSPEPLISTVSILPATKTSLPSYVWRMGGAKQ